MRIVLACSLALVVNFKPSEVGACSPPSIQILEIDPDAVGETAPPSAPIVDSSIHRSADEPGGCGGVDSCGSSAGIYLMVAATDDVTPAGELGFGVELVGGVPPRGLYIDSSFIVDSSFALRFDRSDDRGFSIDLAVFAVDKNGNAGPSTIITVSEPGDSGCASGRSGQSSMILIGLSLLGLVIRRRR